MYGDDLDRRRNEAAAEDAVAASFPFRMNVREAVKFREQPNRQDIP